MSDQFVYYDVCPECSSSDLSVEVSKDDDNLLIIWCRLCGTNWDDYIEEIRNEYN